MKYDLIIPVYNVQNEISHCLDSILHQTHRDFRAIIVDDGSTDGSSAIAREYVGKDSRFEYYRKENGGLSDARNFGIARLSSMYFSFIDGDDFVESDMLKTIDRELAKNPVDVLDFNGWIVEKGKKTRRIINDYVDEGKVKNGRDYMLDNIKARGISTPVWGSVIRSGLIQKHQLLFVKGLLHEDELWTPKLYMTADTVLYRDKCLYNYVQRDGSITHQANKERNARHAKAIYCELEAYYKTLALTLHQRNILLSYLSRRMVGACLMAGEEGMLPYDRAFIMRNARNIRSIGKMLLYFASGRRYEALSRSLREWMGRI